MPPSFLKSQISLAQSYQRIGDDTICESRTSLYTAIDAQCNGWSGISLTECEEKCSKNEVPDNCQQHSIQCKYAQFDTVHNWCHLADDTCKPVSGDWQVTLTMKQGLFF